MKWRNTSLNVVRYDYDFEIDYDEFGYYDFIFAGDYITVWDNDRRYILSVDTVDYEHDRYIDFCKEYYPEEYKDYTGDDFAKDYEEFIEQYVIENGIRIE